MKTPTELHDLWLHNPLGLIDKEAICETCARYNARNVTCNMVVIQNDQVLIIHRDHEPEKGKWGLPGGYLNWDETVTQTAVRELEEETGLHAENVRIIGIRSDNSAGDGRQNVDIYFYTDAVSGEMKPQLGEIADIRWCSFDELPELAFDHGRLLRAFIPVIKSGVFVPVIL